MWAPKSSPYSKSKLFWPDFSAGMASLRPSACARPGMSEPNCSSTSTPTAAGSTPPRLDAISMPSKISRLASAIVSVSSGVGSPWMPNIFFWNDPRWSNARM